MSGGLQRRVSLACSLIHCPPLLILDEPTVGTDPVLRLSIWSHLETLSSSGHTIIAGVGKGGGLAKILPPEIENFQNTPPLSFEIFRRPPPPSGLAKRGRFLPENGQFSRKFGHFVGHFR